MNSFKALFLAMLSVTTISTAAFAHAYLKTADPPVGSTVNVSPTEIRINFTEGVEPSFSGIALATSAGAAVPLGTPAVDPQNDSVLVVKIDGTLAPGTYKVDWHAIAVDTHRTEGNFTFTIAGADAPARSAPSAAQEFKAGDIIIAQPWSRATSKGAPVAGGYMVIRNNGKTEDRLMGGTFADAGKVQVHEMTMQNGIMEMRELSAGLAIPPGGSVTLDPDGDHLMFMGLKRQLMPGETVEGTLVFEHAGKVAVEFRVGGMGDRGPGGTTAMPPPMNMPMPDHGAMPMPGNDSMPMH